MLNLSIKMDTQKFKNPSSLEHPWTSDCGTEEESPVYSRREKRLDDRQLNPIWRLSFAQICLNDHHGTIRHLDVDGYLSSCPLDSRSPGFAQDTGMYSAFSLGNVFFCGQPENGAFVPRELLQVLVNMRFSMATIVPQVCANIESQIDHQITLFHVA